MTRLGGIRRKLYGLGESKAMTSEVQVSLASEPFGRWPTGRNRLARVCVCVCSVSPDRLVSVTLLLDIFLVHIIMSANEIGIISL
jgi:hypothetical protein